MSRNWQNWSGVVKFSPAEIRQPRSLDEIVQLVKDCHATGRKLRVVGSGHSFTRLVETDSVLLSLDEYTGLESVDREACTATVRAGTKIKALGELLYQHGLAQENLGDIDVQSIAGAISTGTHGTGINFGSIATQVVGLTLVAGDGRVIACSETENREWFKAAQVSLGALGVIVGVTLRLLPTYTMRVEVRKKSLADCLTNLEQYKRDNRHFEFHWLPYTDAVQAKFTNLTDETPGTPSLGSKLNEYVLENGALWLFSAFNRAFPAASATVSRTMANFISDTTDVRQAHEIFASVRMVKFQEMEYNLPVEHFAAALDEVNAAIRRERVKVHFPIECRFVRGDDIDLSPAYDRDSAYIAVHMFKGMEYRSYFDLIEPIFMKYGGRPHWGKMHTRRADDLRPLYPRWSQFQAARDALDPARTFSSPYITQVLGE